MLGAGVLLAGTVAQARGERVLTVFAAASLTDFMKDAEKTFEATHPGVQVRTNVAGSSELRLQIEQGAPVDVFLSADAANMNPLVSARLVSKPVVFTHNVLSIVVAKRAQDKVTCITDLTKPGVRLALAAANVPVGNYTRQMLAKVDKAGKCGKDFARKVQGNMRSEEPNVKAVLTKALLGEVDAGVVYATDIAPELQKQVRVITIPAEYNVVASYPIAVLSRSRNKDLARDFQKFVLSPQGKQLLQRRGFLP
jgi:molybdate transport system substrate-binding protein